ncbi:MAG TPA: phospholipase D-like domain-containing protein, partial [Burkholderiales bacterium]
MRPAYLSAWLVALAACAQPAQRGGPAAPLPQSSPPEAPLVRGNEVRLLVDGPQTHGAMLDAMARARDSINVETYILEDGEVGDKFAEVMERKARAGLAVNLIYDSAGSFGTSREYFERLKSAGVRVCEFNPVNPGKKSPRGADLNNRNHRKITVVDGRVAFTGGINIAEAYSYGSVTARNKAHRDRAEDAKRGWRDTDVQVEGPVVAQFQQLFMDAWKAQQCEAQKQARYFPKLEPRGSKMARVVASDPVRGTSEMYGALHHAIRNAKSRVWLAIGYFVPDPDTLQILEEAARRGVDVRLVLPGFSDFWAPIAAARSNYQPLLDAGVKIYEWRQALMHAKTAVIDGQWSSVGSTNLDWRSFVHNYEDDLLVFDPAFGREMEKRY